MNRDHIGYPMATISYTGTVQWQPDPEPFGDVISEQSVGSGHDPLIRYPGQWRVDPVLATTEPAFTTLYYNTHRWYNPTWGRYTQADPLGLEDSLTLYEYSAGNPLTFIDPLGLCKSGRCDDCPSGWWTITEVSLQGFVDLPILGAPSGGLRGGVVTLRCLGNEMTCDYVFGCFLVGSGIDASFSAGAGLFGFGDEGCTCAEDYEGTFHSGQVGFGGAGRAGGGGGSAASPNGCWGAGLNAGLGLSAYGRYERCEYRLLDCR